jgi:hypothetical protein
MRRLCHRAARRAPGLWQAGRSISELHSAASIEEPALIERILSHRRERGGEEATTVSLGARAPPQASLLSFG